MRRGARTWLLATTACLALATGAAAQQPSRQDRDRAEREYAAGQESMEREDFEAAVRRFAAATELDPGYVLAYYSLGQAHMALKHYAEAATAYETCRDVIRHESSLDQRAQADADRKRRDAINELKEALERLRRTEAARPGSTRPGADIAIEQRIRLLEQANLKGADRQVRVPAELWLALGSARFRLGHMDRAEQAYREAIRADARLGAAHNNLAVICMMSGRYDEARQHVKAAEDAGFPVSPQFKADLEARAK